VPLHFLRFNTIKTRTPKLPMVVGRTRPCRSAPVPGRSNWLRSSRETFLNHPPIAPGCGRDSDKLRFREHATKSVSRAGGRSPPTQKFNFGVRINGCPGAMVERSGVSPGRFRCESVASLTSHFDAGFGRVCALFFLMFANFLEASPVSGTL
jgi:hypothetical protein